MWKDTVFSLVKNNMVMLFSLLVSDYFGCLHCFPNRCWSHFGFCTITFLFLSKTIKCWYAFFVRCKEHFGNKIILIFQNFLLLSLQCFTSSTEHQCHDVHVLFGDISYDVRSAHWHVNNKIKIKLPLFSVNTIKTFVKILTFSLNLMKIFMVFTAKE